MVNNKYVTYRYILKSMEEANYIQMESVFNMIQNYSKANGEDELFDKLKERYYIKLKGYEDEEI